MTIKLKKINNTIIKCKKCPRLVSFIKKISIQKRKQNKSEKYWGKPVPGFGDHNARLMILGLAPAAHGGTRTGRAFTGDKSGNFLFKSLNYFENEIENLKNLKVIITLGKVAFDNCLRIYKKKFVLQKKFEFKHGNKYLLPDNKVLIACYHPSPRNVNTKIVTTTMINQLLIKAKKIAKF